MKIKCKNSFYLRESVAPQAFYINDQDVYYFDKTNQYEGRFCIKDNCGERSIYQIDDGYGIFDNKGDMYILNLNMESGITKYSGKNCSRADFQMEGIFYDIKVDEDENYLFLGNVNGKTIIRLMDENYNEKRNIMPQGIIFGSSISIYGENIYLGAVGDNDKLKVLKMNYIGNVLESYNINVNSRNRIISKIDMIENFLIILISGKKQSIVIYDLISKSTKEIFIYQLELDNAFDILINKNNIAVLSERKITEFELKELCMRKISSSGISFKINTDTGLYTKMMYSIQLYECIYKYLYISFCISVFEYFILYIFKAVNHYGIFEGIMFITLFTLIINYCFGIISSIFNLSKKHNRVEKLLYIFNKKYSKLGIFLTS
jgi:hypothetical protein